jgi:hypothetical protein
VDAVEQAAAVRPGFDQKIEVVPADDVIPAAGKEQVVEVGVPELLQQGELLLAAEHRHGLVAVAGGGIDHQVLAPGELVDDVRRRSGDDELAGIGEPGIPLGEDFPGLGILRDKVIKNP